MSSTILKRFSTSMLRCGLTSADNVSVALSGGPDSLALAALTVSWKGSNGRKSPPVALVVDHRLRPGSTEEARAVCSQAEALGLTTRLLTIDWPDGVAPARGAKLAAARVARYDVLVRACIEMGSTHLLLGHHREDQAETFIMRLLFASGLAGLACMPAVSPISTGHGSIQLARPLLQFHKHELEQYCQLSGLRYVVDPTNADVAYIRNRVRHLLQHHTPYQPAHSALAVPHTQGRKSTSAATAAEQQLGAISLVQDCLALAARCEAVSSQLREAGLQLLSRAVLHTSLPQLPCRQQPPPPPGSRWVQQPAAASAGCREQQRLGPKPQQTNSQSQLPHQVAQPPACRMLQPLQLHAEGSVWLPSSPPRLPTRQMDAERMLAKVASKLRDLPFALLCVVSLQGAPDADCLAALSRLLHTVSGQPYPPRLAQVTALRALLRDSGLTVSRTFFGSGCMIKRVSGCKGRYVMCLRLHDVQQASQQLKLMQRVPANQGDRSPPVDGMGACCALSH